MAGAGDGKFHLKAQVEGLNVFSIVATSLVTTILFFVILYYLKGLYFRTLSAEYERKNAVTFVELQDIRVEQSARLSSYQWTDEENGFASIPIAEAQKEFISRMNSGRAIFPDLPDTAPPPPPVAAAATDDSAAGEVLSPGAEAPAGAESAEDAHAVTEGAAAGGH
jgi:hypothetical protein